MAPRKSRLLRWPVVLLCLAVVLAGAAAFVWREDILRTALDPKEPFQTYDPPPPPDYGRRTAWALFPGDGDTHGAEDLAADVFFVGPTTYDGGEHWNAPLDEPKSNRLFRRVMAPNYAGPFLRVGRVYAPRYRQASLYSLLTLREDARDARRFAYADVAAAFRWYRDHQNRGRPFVVVGVEQGGTLVARLLAEEIAPNAALRPRLAAAYMIEAVAPAGGAPLPPCTSPRQVGCLAAWISAFQGDVERPQAILDRSLVWAPGGQLENLTGRRPLCFNPLMGAVTDAQAPARLNLGAANATGLEWGARPAFLTRQVAAQCEGGILRVTRPKSPTLKRSGSWADRRKAPGYNLFYADIEADAQGRVAALLRPAAPVRDGVAEAVTDGKRAQ